MRSRLKRLLFYPFFASINRGLVQPAREEAARSDLRLHNEALDRDRGSQERDAALAARLDRVEGELAGIARHLPFVLERLSESNAMARESRRRLAALEQRAEQIHENSDGVQANAEGVEENARRIADTERVIVEMRSELGATWQRIEFVRKEMMHEFRHGNASPGAFDEQEPVVINADKLETRPLRINLGCGHVPLDGYVNCDVRELDGVDVVAEVSRLPFGSGSVDEIHSAHLLEHFPLEELRRRILPYWVDLLAPSGAFVAIVPDAQKMIEAYAEGDYSFEDLRLVTYGEQEYTGDFHFNMFSRDDLEELLRAAGLVDLEWRAIGRRNGACYEMEIFAKKPS